jgi:hypothetical protein
MTIEVMLNLEGLVGRLKRAKGNRNSWLVAMNDIDIAILEAAIKALKKEGYQ